MKRRIALALAALMTLTACGGGEERQEGLFYEAAGISPDAVLLTVDGRDVPAWRYLYWLTSICDTIRASRGQEGKTLDWSEPLLGGTLADYAKQQALASTALYATVENWAETYSIALTDADRDALEEDWAEKAASYGGEEAYLAALADMGLERADAMAMSADHYLYQALYEWSLTEDSPLHPAEAELEAFAAESGALSVDFIRISTAGVDTGDTEAMDQRRQEAEAAFAALNASADPAGDFAALAETYSDDENRARHPMGYTLTPGDGTLPSVCEEAAAALEAGQWSGIVEAEDGFYILLRRPLDQTAAAGACFDQRLQAAAEAAEIRLGKTYDAIHAGEFYERLVTARQQADAAE